MGILNMTPDSFSDGGSFPTLDDAIGHALDIVSAGADIIDIGGESTRPGSDPVSVDIEVERAIPVIRELSSLTSVPISIDTMKPEVAEMALRAGATMVNDVLGLRADGMVDVVREWSCHTVIMHMHGSPKTLGTNLMKGDALPTIKGFLDSRVEFALDQGISEDKLILDPGIGFGTTSEQGLDILRNASYFSKDLPILIGPSRKRFLAQIYPDVEPDVGTAMACQTAIGNGADIVRVHNVEMTIKVIRE